MLLRWTQQYTAFSQRIQSLKNQYLRLFLSLSSFLPRYYRLNDLMWQDGLLIDFLQKKVVDKWIRKFLVCSSYLFSERTLFKFVVRFYIDTVVMPFSWGMIFETSNVAAMLSFTTLVISFLLLFLNLNYLYILLV